ncbi:mucin-13 isoform X2 [Rana temporaria]|uniref:mucin-13 isoform X2 n=1 Tax=Rana temporaria TaxID=8407 RepID=UPI001AAC6838|nr:mucin-13 isoform X2 [Rana temporaria]
MKIPGSGIISQRGAMRGILSICVTCALLLAYVGATTTVPQSTISGNVTTDNSNSSAPGATETTGTATSDANTTSTVSAPSTITTSAVSAPTSDTNNNVTTLPGVSGNTTGEDTISFSTQDTSSSNDTGTTSNPNVTAPSQDITQVAVTTANLRSCSSNPCGNVQCIQLYNDYVCRCPLGFAFINSTLSCRPGDAFYGEVTIPDVEFNSDPTSPQYTAVYQNVINNFQTCFENFTNYLSTTILELRQTTTKNARATNTVVAQVSNNFGQGTEDNTTVAEAIDNYIKQTSTFGSYAEQTICSAGVYCDDKTTTCTAYSFGQSAICTCISGLYSSQPIVTTCKECSPDCTSSNGQQCKQGSADVVSQCVCLPGYKSKDGGCKKCDFGYSGEECKDDYLLILVIVAVVLGAFVLGLVGAVIGVSLRSRKGKSGERAELIDDDKLGKSSPAPVSLFPKVQMKPDLGQVNRASNVYEEEEEEYRRTMPKRDYDENPWYEMDRKDRNY